MATNEDASLASENPSAHYCTRMRASYRFLPKDYVSTSEGLIFAVVTPGIEDGRVLCFLRYQRHGEQLRKHSSSSANRLLLERFPQYLFHSKARDVRCHAVALDSVQHHYRPLEFQPCCPAGNGSRALQVRIASWLVNRFGELGSQVGISGSLLLGAQTDQSDIDLVAYGRAGFEQARRIVGKQIQTGIFQELDTDQWYRTYERRGCALSFEDYVRHELRKLNKFVIEGVKVDLSCVAQPPADAILAGRKLGRTAIRGYITNDSHGFNSPAMYELRHPTVARILVFTPTYVGQARHGEFVEAAGWLERAGDHQRLVVGTSREAAREYIRVLE